MIEPGAGGARGAGGERGQRDERGEQSAPAACHLPGAGKGAAGAAEKLDGTAGTMAMATASAPPAPAPALRLHLAGTAFVPHAEFELPAAAARHAMVRRVQPGQPLHLFDGRGTEWPAQVLTLSRTAVRVRVRLAAQPLPAAARELPLAVTLAFCMPANERVDALVEKATELGVAALQPLMSERSVLRLAGERAERRRAHWQAVAVSACEQCGRAHLPVVHPVRELAPWLHDTTPAGAGRWLLSTSADATPWPQAWPAPAGAAVPVVLLSGPEGGLATAEERAARDAGFVPVSLGPRILRADTAPLAALAWLALSLA